MSETDGMYNGYKVVGVSALTPDAAALLDIQYRGEPSAAGQRIDRQSLPVALLTLRNEAGNVEVVPGVVTDTRTVVPYTDETFGFLPDEIERQVAQWETIAAEALPAGIQTGAEAPIVALLVQAQTVPSIPQLTRVKLSREGNPSLDVLRDDQLPREQPIDLGPYRKG